MRSKNVPLAMILSLCLLQASPVLATEDEAPESADTGSNRYVGLTVGSSGTPYIGSERNTWVFPIYRTFDDSLITDERFISQGGVFGVRWIQDSGLQYGLLGRVQPLGYTAADSPALTGMADRESTFEGGPWVGYRREHFQVHMAYFTDVLDEHGGNEVRLVVSLPFEVAHRFFIVHFDAFRQSAELADYYYGVLPGEAIVGRPAYAPGAVTNFAVGFRTGWHVGKRMGVWLDASHELFDSAVEDSPIVDSGNAWNISIGVGYNF